MLGVIGTKSCNFNVGYCLAYYAKVPGRNHPMMADLNEQADLALLRSNAAHGLHSRAPCEQQSDIVKIAACLAPCEATLDQS